MKSTEFLQAAIDVQKERGEQYDKPNGERSMAATVSAFNCITGYALEESDGWMFMALLKLVRQAQNPEKYHHDSALDLVAYSSLYAEAASTQHGKTDKQNPLIDLPSGLWEKGDILRVVDVSDDTHGFTIGSEVEFLKHDTNKRRPAPYAAQGRKKWWVLLENLEFVRRPGA